MLLIVSPHRSSLCSKRADSHLGYPQPFSIPIVRSSPIHLNQDSNHDCVIASPSNNVLMVWEGLYYVHSRYHDLCYLCLHSPPQKLFHAALCLWGSLMISFFFYRKWEASTMSRDCQFPQTGRQYLIRCTRTAQALHRSIRIEFQWGSSFDILR